MTSSLLAAWMVAAQTLAAINPVPAPPPRPAFVQVKDANYGSNGPRSFALGFPNPVTSGNLVLIAVGRSGTTVSITDSWSNVYVRAGATNPGQGSLSGYTQEIWYTVISATTAVPFSVTYQTSSSYNVLDVHQLEYSGVSQANPIDRVLVASSAHSLAMDGGTLVTQVPHEALVSWDVSFQTVTDGGPGFTTRTTTGKDMVQDFVTDTPGAFTPTATSNDPNWVMETVALYPMYLPDGGTFVLDGGAADGGTVDAGAADAGASDAGAADAGASDAGEPTDGGLDAGQLDGGDDAGADAGDSGADAGVDLDGGKSDGGVTFAVDRLGADVGGGCSAGALPISSVALLAALAAQLLGRKRRPRAVRH